MNDKKEILQVTLALRAASYQWYATIFGVQPDEELLNRLFTEEAIQAVCAYLPQAEAAALETWAVDVRVADDSEIGRLRDAYTALFAGPGALPVKPWESVYATGDNTLFQGCTLAVRQAYARAGFVTEGYPHVADDHLASELSFMAGLAERMCKSIGDSPEYTADIVTSLSFLQEHLLRWIDTYAALLAKQDARFALWQTVAQALSAFVREDASVLQELSREALAA